jgi:hypothetical protein
MISSSAALMSSLRFETRTESALSRFMSATIVQRLGVAPVRMVRVIFIFPRFLFYISPLSI